MPTPLARPGELRFHRGTGSEIGCDCGNRSGDGVSRAQNIAGLGSWAVPSQRWLFRGKDSGRKYSVPHSYLLISGRSGWRPVRVDIVDVVSPSHPLPLRDVFGDDMSRFFGAQFLSDWRRVFGSRRQIRLKLFRLVLGPKALRISGLGRAHSTALYAFDFLLGQQPPDGSGHRRRNHDRPCMWRIL